MKHLSLIAALLLPLAYLLYALFVSGTEDPIKFIYTVTGATAITLLFATTSLSLLKKHLNLMRYRRSVGLMGFFYALLHLLNFVILDMELDPALILEESVEKPFIYLGLIAFFGLLFMAVTSFKPLFAKYYRYHKVIYVVLILITVHFVMAQKALSMNQWGYLLIIVVIGIAKLLQRTRLLSRKQG